MKYHYKVRRVDPGTTTEIKEIVVLGMMRYFDCTTWQK